MTRTLVRILTEKERESLSPEQISALDQLERANGEIIEVNEQVEFANEKIEEGNRCRRYGICGLEDQLAVDLADLMSDGPIIISSGRTQREVEAGFRAALKDCITVGLDRYPNIRATCERENLYK